jgi:hypothetical protein
MLEIKKIEKFFACQREDEDEATNHFIRCKY